MNFQCKEQVTDEVKSLNGLSRIETDKNIRKMFGTLDDFLLSSMASQLDSLTFINEGSTRRKEILAKFLDLEIFEQKYKLAKEDASDLRGALRRLQDKEFDEEIDDDRNILTSISIALEKEGFKVQTYVDGESALIGLTRTPPDLAIVDIKMPKMDGEELLKN